MAPNRLISVNRRISPAPRAGTKAADFHAEVANPQQHKGIGTAEVNPNIHQLKIAATGSHAGKLDPAPDTAIVTVPGIVSDNEITLTAGRRRGDLLARQPSRSFAKTPYPHIRGPHYHDFAPEAANPDTLPDAATQCRHSVIDISH